ncbi:MAG TPA: pyridoxal phosphate-dependent aminotransferase [Solirubrobacteraceae bacterium]|nr:pyridoxal phosphate-dependent aminotransferase [Solirubrobacteraceae bacterium]
MPAETLTDAMRPTRYTHSSKLTGVAYDIRGPVLTEAIRLEEEGHRILHLNVGNPAPFGFDAPNDILLDVIRALPTSQGYSDSKGLLTARRAVVQYYEAKGTPGINVEDIYLGNGVSELIQVAMQAVLEAGDEVLIPSPDYPLWTAATQVAGGQPAHYRCDETADWFPDLEDIRSRVTDRTKVIVVINPNNPTGAVYPPSVLDGILEIAREHSLIVCADEIYDKIVYDEASHIAISSLAGDVLCLTFSGLSKTYRVAGFRSGWLALSGPKARATDLIKGLDLLTNMRLCPNVPAQHAIQTALGGYQSIEALVAPGGRLHTQRDCAFEMLNAIPGVSCVKAMGAVYAFPRLDPEIYKIKDDQRLVLDLLKQEKMLVVHGSAFNLPTTDHFRLVTLPHVEDLEDAFARLARFLADYQQ